MTHYNKHVFVCTNQKGDGKICCASSGAKDIFGYLKEQTSALGLAAHAVRISQSGCLGRCQLGPCIVIYPEGVWYTYGSIADIDEIIHQHLISGQIVDRLLINS
jgi:(2Fe-2S) ferredoxin